MPLNYSKWDQLELSDDSDVEVHPNVDKKSFIRWKQRDIHEKREERKRKIAFLKSEIDLNNTLLKPLDELISNVHSEGTDYFERRVSELAAIKDRPDAPKPATGNPNQPSYDNMLHALMTTVADEVKKAKPSTVSDKSERSKALEETLKTHRRQLTERTEQCKMDIEYEEAEAKKHITSEDIHEGWSAGSVNKNAASAQVVDPIDSSAARAKKVKGKEKEIEVLNPKSTGSQADVVPSSSGYTPDTEGQSTRPAAFASDDEDDEDEEVPTMTDSAKRFVQIQPGNWELAYRAISSDPSLLREEIDDAILVEAFECAMKGKRKDAMACVHASKILQYCRKLGKDGVALFFKRMATNKDALRVFEDDVKQTWDRIDARSKELAAERAEANESGERETIQLVAQDPSTKITFEIPDGPPPAELKLEGEGSESMDIEKVREFLQTRWDIFQSFPKNLKKALEKKDLEEVNRVLGRMSVDEGEETVRLLDEAGILSFSSTDIVDKTQEQKQQQGQ